MKGLTTICVSITSVFILVLGPAPTKAIHNNICRLFADGVTLRDPSDCASYITCTDSIEVSTKCPSGQLFSVDSKKCISSTDSCDDPCAPDYDGIWAADPISCNGYYYCNNGTGTLGKCPDDLHFDEDEQKCVYKSYSNCDGDKYCHIVPNSINFKDEEFCDRYYYCDKGVLNFKACKVDLLYSRTDAKCVSKTLLNGCESLPTDVCMNGKKIEKNKFVSDKATCRGYYYCADMNGVADPSPVRGQCSEGSFFDYSTQSCTDPINVGCNGNRCDGRPDMFVNGGGNCQKYLVCKNGQIADQTECANYNFFDEKRQACTSEVIEYKGCT